MLAEDFRDSFGAGSGGCDLPVMEPNGKGNKRCSGAFSGKAQGDSNSRGRAEASESNPESVAGRVQMFRP